MKITDIINYLDQKQFRHAQKGFEYIADAIKICVESPKFKHKTCELYSAVAGMYETTPTRVERAIRHSIETSGIEKESNSEFIAKAADYFIFN